MSAEPTADYIEEEDEDYDPNVSSELSDDELPTKKQKLDHEEEDDHDPNYQNIENQEGGLVKTRAQRAKEAVSEKYHQTDKSESTINVNEIWNQMQAQSKQRLKQRYSSSSSPSTTPQPMTNNEMIKISRKYEFAGEKISEEKWVHRESAEAKEYLRHIDGVHTKHQEKANASKSSTTNQTGVSHEGLNLRRVYKRPPLLEGIINGSIKPKFNTLQKSKVDFAKFVDKEGIDDELNQNTKDGYLGKQDFLSRVEFTRDSKFKEIRSNYLKNKK